MKVFSKSSPSPDKPPTALISAEPPEFDSPDPPPGTLPEACHGDDCRIHPNLVAPIVGSLCGILAVALIGVFIIWFYLRRKYKKTKDTPMTPAIKFIEQPSLYTGSIGTTDSTSALHEVSPTRNNSINSHYYEKIHYNE
ncbi:unnamed protein product [Rotaria sp. Silwood2]|nr:unnamed protein product [Rotaria sp. Silwood2]CAF2572416.1 unnamed protein product [Rotaria sp. Silwood2]CAF2733055.1 unnamed protein product [Rotaria sp. Silwood2]CAF2900132.1 unnamed protein product [Rotaria sp. Silwood2]CAF4029472.1 unnamed protein product [Rotaria sp. Silwood2]